MRRYIGKLKKCFLSPHRRVKLKEDFRKAIYFPSTIFYRHFLRYISKVHFGKQRTETKSNKYRDTMEYRRFYEFVCFVSAKLSYWLTRWLSCELYTYYFQNDQGET